MNLKKPLIILICLLIAVPSIAQEIAQAGSINGGIIKAGITVNYNLTFNGVYEMVNGTLSDIVGTSRNKNNIKEEISKNKQTKYKEDATPYAVIISVQKTLKTVLLDLRAIAAISPDELILFLQYNTGPSVWFLVLLSSILMSIRKKDTVSAYNNNVAIKNA